MNFCERQNDELTNVAEECVGNVDFFFYSTRAKAVRIGKDTQRKRMANGDKLKPTEKYRKRERKREKSKTKFNEANKVLEQNKSRPPNSDNKRNNMKWTGLFLHFFALSVLFVQKTLLLFSWVKMKIFSKLLHVWLTTISDHFQNDLHMKFLLEWNFGA